MGDGEAEGGVVREARNRRAGMVSIGLGSMLLVHAAVPTENFEVPRARAQWHEPVPLSRGPDTEMNSQS